MRLCTTAPLEHQFGTARSHKQEFTARDFCLFVDKIGTIFTHISKFDFNTTTSDKGYMSGFRGFVKTVSNISKKVQQIQLTEALMMMQFMLIIPGPLQHRSNHWLLKQCKRHNDPCYI
jgi:hypothetical protein